MGPQVLSAFGIPDVTAWAWAWTALGAAFLVLFWAFSSFVEWILALDLTCRDLSSIGGFLEDPNTLLKIPLPTVFAAAEKSLTIVFPAYNEALRLASTLEDTLRYLENRAKVEPSFTYELVVVDDGSKDGTAAVAHKFCQVWGLDKVRVIRQPSNQGKGAAVRKGMLCSRGALLLFADADSATKVSDLEKLELELWKLVLKARPLQPGEQNGGPATAQKAANDASTAAGGTGARAGAGAGVLAGAVLGHLRGAAEVVPAAAFGSRAHLEQKALATRKWYRNVLMRGFHLAVILAGGSGLRDTQCGFKLFTRAAARQIFPNQRLKRWCFDVEILYLCKELRIPFAEVAVTWTEVPGSKLRFTSVLHMLLELAYVRVGYGLGIWPIRREYSQG